MWLMRIAKGVEACTDGLFDTRFYLFVAKRVTLAKLVFVFANAIYECWLAVEYETFVAIVASLRPADGAESKGCVGALGGFAVAFYYGIYII